MRIELPKLGDYMYRLLIEDDEGRTTIVPLIRNQINIGREEGNTIRLTERNVSRRHARLALKDGAITIEDLQSYNGVWINGERMGAVNQVNPGDLIEIGDYHLSVQEETADAEVNGQSSLPPEQDFNDSTPPLGGTPIAPSAEAQEQSVAQASRLVIINTALSGQEFALHKSELTIGRTDDNDIFLDHASVSRHHAKLVLQGDAFQLVDLGSANGVQVNGEEYGMCDLRWGDIIELGQVRLRFCSQDDPFEAVPIQSSSFTSRSQVTAPPKSKMGLFIGVGVAVLALGIGGFLFLGGSSNGPSDTASKQVKTRDRLPPSPRDALQTPEGQQKRLKQAMGSFEQEDYKHALKLLNQILAVRSDWAQALDLKKQVEFEMPNLKRFQMADNLKVEGDLQKAYTVLGEVSPKSRHFAQARIRRKEMKPQLVQDLMDRATRKMNQKDYRKALLYTDEVLVIDKNHEAALAMQKSLHSLLNKDLDSPRRRPGKRRKRRKKPYRKRSLRRRAKVPARTRLKKKKKKSGRDICRAMYKKGKLKSALKCFQTWSRKHSRDSVSYVYMGGIAGEIGKCQKTKGRIIIYCMMSEGFYKEYLRRWPKGRYAKKVRAALPNKK